MPNGSPEKLDRIGRVEHIIDVYQYDYRNGGEPDSTLSDVLADMLHYCEANDFDFDDLVRMGRAHYEDERRA